MPEGDPATLVFGYTLERRLEALFRRGERVLDLDGGGPAAARLSAGGIEVVPASGAQRLAAAGDGFDGAYATTGRLDGADLAAASPALAAALRPGASILLTWLGPWPLPQVLWRTLSGMGERRRGHELVARRVTRPPTYPTLRQARQALGPAFQWTDGYALGVLLPDASGAGWVRDHPQCFAALAMMERIVRRWPGLRQLGDRLVLEGHRAGPS
jgi:hypothetical protein